MLYGNQLENALKDKNLISKPRKVKRPRHRKFQCHKCGKNMFFVDNTNVMACECGQYFIFSDN